MYACMHVCMYVCMYVHNMYVGMYLCSRQGGPGMAPEEFQVPACTSFFVKHEATTATELFCSVVKISLSTPKEPRPKGARLHNKAH